MTIKFDLSEQSQTKGLENRIEELKLALMEKNHVSLAEMTGSDLSINNEQIIFNLTYFGNPIHIHHHDFIPWSNTKGDLPLFTQIMILYYFITADGFEKTDKFITFAQLPGGNMYSRAFQGYSGNDIVKAVGIEVQKLKDACLLLGGKQSDVSDASFVFSILPKFEVKLVYWVGDDEFPSSCQFLFNSSALHYLPIDGCAIIGSQLTRKIIKNLNQTK